MSELKVPRPKPVPLGLTRAEWLTAAIGAAAACMVMTVRLGAVAELPAYLYFAVIGILLAMIDARTRKLPDRLTLPSYPILIVLLSTAEASSSNQGSMMRAAEAAALLLCLFLSAAVFLGVGLGDAKLAGILGLLLGFRGWMTVYDGILIAFVFGAVFVAVCALRGQKGGRIPLGPFLVAGTVIAVLL